MPTEKQIVKYLTELADGYQRNDAMYEAKLVSEPLSSPRWANGMAAARGALLALEQALDYIKDGKVIAPPSVALSTPEQDAAASAKFDEKVKNE